MRSQVRWLHAAVAGVLCCAGSLRAEALELHSDLQASVEVDPVFAISISNPHLNFPHVEPGQVALLGQDGFFNEVRCRSNAGQPWKLRIQRAPREHTAANDAGTVPRVQFRVVEVLGGASHPLRGGVDFEDLPDEPVTVYEGIHDEEIAGVEVVFRLQYRLLCPDNVPAGRYHDQVVFTLTDTP